jgi:hypothetical protein
MVRGLFRRRDPADLRERGAENPNSLAENVFIMPFAIDSGIVVTNIGGDVVGGLAIPPG